MTTELEPRQVAAWHREQAKFHLSMAQQIESRYQIAPSVAVGRTDPIREVTAEQLEQAVKQKAGRVADLAKRLQTSQQNITNLLNSGAKVQKAKQGWIKALE